MSRDGYDVTRASGSKVIGARKNKWDATTAPDGGDDADDGYEVGSVWMDVTAGDVYRCEDDTVAAAVWLRMVVDLDFEAKGDILIATGASAFVALAVGADDLVLTADAAEASGVKWASVSGGGTPASTVTDETTFGISTAVGTDTEYARQDHTHGSPTDPVTAHVALPDAHHARSHDHSDALDGQNLAPVSIDGFELRGAVTVDSDSAYDLGAAGERIANIYVSNIDISTSALPDSDAGANIGSAALKFDNVHTYHSVIYADVLPDANNSHTVGSVAKTFSAMHANIITAYTRFEAYSDGNTPDLQFGRQNGGLITPSSNMGTLHFYGHDGSDFELSARIRAQTGSSPALDDIPGKLVFGTRDDGDTDVTDRWVIQSNGDFDPVLDSTYDIGSSALRVSTIFSDFADIGSVTVNDTTGLRPDVGGGSNVGSDALRFATGFFENVDASTALVLDTGSASWEATPSTQAHSDSAAAGTATTFARGDHVHGMPAAGGHAQVHVLATGTALGADHTMSGATAGDVLRALSATTAAFDVLAHGDLSDAPTDAHHTEVHTVASTGPHAQSGLTIGHFLRASTTSAFDFAAIADGDIPATHAGSAHHTKYLDSEAIAAVEGEATLDLTGAVSVAGAFDATQRFNLTGHDAPTQLTANTNDLAISADAGLIVLDTDGGSFNLSGMTNGSEGRVIAVYNNDTAGTITLLHDQISTAANRFFTGVSGSDYLLPPFSGVVMIYDNSRWRVLANNVPAPALSVVAETTFGLSSAVGTGIFYSSQNHSHGSPTDPVTAHVALPNAHHAQSHDHSAAGDGQILNPVTVGELDPTTTSVLDGGSDSLRWQHWFVEGINFPATQVASGDANTLDDYEEGIWTPDLGFETPGDESVILSTAHGVYTRVGRIVHIIGQIITSTFTHTTASGALEITGLPFTNGESVFKASTVLAQGWSRTDVVDLQVMLTAGATTAQIWNSRDNASWRQTNSGDWPTGGTVKIVFSATYRV